MRLERYQRAVGRTLTREQDSGELLDTCVHATGQRIVERATFDRTGKLVRTTQGGGRADPCS